MAKDPYSTRALFARLWRDYLRAHSGSVGLALLLMTIEGTTLGVLSWMLKPMFDRVFVGGETTAIWWVGTGILALFATRAITGVGQRTILTRISQRTTTDMQIDLLGHLMTLDGPFFQKHPPGNLMERVQGDTQAVQGVWQTLIQGVGRDTVSLVALFTVAVSTDPVWTLTACFGIPLLVLPSVVLQRYVRRKSQEMREVSADRATRLDEIFHGIGPVKLNGMEGYQLGRFRGLVDRLVTANVKTAAGRAMIPGLIDIMTGLGFFGVLMVGGAQIAAGEKTVGDFMAFFTAMALAFQPLRRLGSIAGVFQVAAASLERLYRLFDTAPTITDGAGATPDGTAIRFDDVRFAYDETEVLRGLSFTAEAGQTTALVGPSGAGKSTLFALLTRLADPQSGAITLGGAPVDQMPLGTLRDHFSVVSQDAMLFDETLAENLTLGRDIAPERIRAALEAAHLSETVAAMPEGLETRAGPRGSALSGGQRQRVAIARALLRNTPVLLLDEATSALDTRSEAVVQAALDDLSQGRTTLVIAHRLSTVQRADKIVVIDKGRVVQQGPHEALLAQGGLYADLYHMQFQAEDTE